MIPNHQNFYIHSQYIYLHPRRKALNHPQDHPSELIGQGLLHKLEESVLAHILHRLIHRTELLRQLRAVICLAVGMCIIHIGLFILSETEIDLGKLVLIVSVNLKIIEDTREVQERIDRILLQRNELESLSITHLLNHIIQTMDVIVEILIHQIIETNREVETVHFFGTKIKIQNSNFSLHLRDSKVDPDGSRCPLV